MNVDTIIQKKTCRNIKKRTGASNCVAEKNQFEDILEHIVLTSQSAIHDQTKQQVKWQFEVLRS